MRHSTQNASGRPIRGTLVPMPAPQRNASRLVAALREQGHLRHFSRGELVFGEGDVAERLFVLDHGWVLIRSSGPDGRDVVLGLRGPGEVLGEMSVLDGKPRSASAVAAAESDVFVVPAAALHRLLETDHQATRELLIVIAERLREADRRRLEYTTRDTLARVAGRLLELTDRFGDPSADGIHLELPLVQEDLARWCGASRESTVKALRTLRGLGVVTTARRTVTVHDERALRRAAQGLAPGG
jgi:CRP/FNR family transcriptional regulator, cyclic AMP receptor protein